MYQLNYFILLNPTDYSKVREHMNDKTGVRFRKTLRGGNTILCSTGHGLHRTCASYHTSKVFRVILGMKTIVFIMPLTFECTDQLSASTATQLGTDVSSLLISPSCMTLLDYLSMDHVLHRCFQTSGLQHCPVQDYLCYKAVRRHHVTSGLYDGDRGTRGSSLVPLWAKIKNAMAGSTS